MVTGIELAMMLVRIKDSNIIGNRYGKKEINNLIFKIIELINYSLSQNITHIESVITKERALEVYHLSTKIINEKLSLILMTSDIEYDDYIKKSDIIKYQFENLDEIKEKMMKIKKAKKEHLCNFIEEKYGSIWHLSLSMGWILGNGNKKMLSKLGKTGIYFGYMMKISEDFYTLKDELEIVTNKSNNFIINFGIQESFELFRENKTNFIENCMMLDIFTDTIKAEIDIMEKKIDDFIENTTPDMKSQYTLSNASKKN